MPEVHVSWNSQIPTIEFGVRLASGWLSSAWYPSNHWLLSYIVVILSVIPTTIRIKYKKQNLKFSLCYST